MINAFRTLAFGWACQDLTSLRLNMISFHVFFLHVWFTLLEREEKIYHSLGFHHILMYWRFKMVNPPISPHDAADQDTSFAMGFVPITSSRENILVHQNTRLYMFKFSIPTKIELPKEALMYKVSTLSRGHVIVVQLRQLHVRFKTRTTKVGWAFELV